ncbi:MAG TPA: cyanophycinase [Pilimelia sp.]|nr:cyanophycinase [Pilimelia sp.]
MIGGNEGHEPGGDQILARFVELAGGPKARIAVVAAFDAGPDHIAQRYVQTLIRLGATHVEALHVRSRADACGEATLTAVEQCGGVFFTGGDQLRIATVIGGSRLDSVLHARMDRGDLVLAGSGAGAAALASAMLIGDDGQVSAAAGRTGPGLEFLSGLLIDTGFAALGRLNRLLSAIALYPHELGVGIDEDTAVVVGGGQFEVLGTGSVTVIDAGNAAMIRTPATGDGPIAVSGVRLHVLPAGYAFDLQRREPIAVEVPADVHDRGVLV